MQASIQVLVSAAKFKQTLMVDFRVFVKYFYVSMELFIAELSKIALWTKSLKYPRTIFFCGPPFLSCCVKVGYRRPMSIMDLGNLVTVEMGFRWRVIWICVIKQCEVHPEIFIPRRTWIVMVPAALRYSIATPGSATLCVLWLHTLNVIIRNYTFPAYKTRQIWLKI